MTEHETASALPLAGVKVMDLTWAVAGPIIGKYLAMFGATVVKVESRKRPDSSRMSGPFRGGRQGINRAGTFPHMNASKQSIGLRLDLESGRPVVEAMVRWADIVLENFSPGVIDRMGLGYPALRGLNRRIILLSTSMQGGSGPRSLHPGFGANLQALSGLDFLSGFPDGDFGSPTAVLPDFYGPWFALATILDALEERERTGDGTSIEIAQYETMLQVLAPALIEASAGIPQSRHGNRSPDAIVQGVFPTADGRWLALTVPDGEAWARLEATLSLAVPHRAGQRPAGLDAPGDQDALEAALAEATAFLPAQDLEMRLQEAGIPAHLVANGRDLLDDRQLIFRGHFVMSEHPVLGEIPIDGPSFTLEGAPPYVAAGPTYGRDTRTFVHEALGFSTDEIDALATEGVLQFE